MFWRVLLYMFNIYDTFIRWKISHINAKSSSAGMDSGSFWRTRDSALAVFKSFPLHTSSLFLKELFQLLSLLESD
jgi:hypothetical protein